MRTYTRSHSAKCEQKKNQLRSLRICSLAPTSGFSCSVHPKYGYAHSAHCIIFGYIRSTFNASKGDAWHETKKQTKKRNFSHKNCFQLLVHQKIHIISADYIQSLQSVFCLLLFLFCLFVLYLVSFFYLSLSLCPILHPVRSSGSLLQFHYSHHFSFM